MFWRALLGIALFCLLASGARASMSSGSYRIDWDSSNTGGTDQGTSELYRMHSTVGEVVAGTSSGAAYALAAGYRAGEAVDALSLAVAAQTVTTTPDSLYSGLNVVGKTVTVGTPNVFSVGDMIAVVENIGFSQLVIVGKITSIAGSVITVGEFAGDTSSMSSVPGGGNDGVYRLSGTTLTFGQLAATTETTIVIASTVRSTASAGYLVYLQGADTLKNTSGNALTVVTDGAVTAGVEEYGASVTGALAVNPGVDLGVTTTPRLIQSSTGLSSVDFQDRTATTFKISITSATLPGTYTQTVYYTLVPRY